MRSRPTFWQRVMGPLRGEVSAAALEAYRRASGLVYELIAESEHRRHNYAVAGIDAWSVPPALRAEAICAWNAYALQTVGDAIVDADYQESPATARYVPHETAQQVLRFYVEVEGWLNLAHQARANPAFRLKVNVPAPLPRWGTAPLSRAQLRGVLAAMRSLESHASAAVASLSNPEPEHRAWKGQLATIAQAHASAVTTARYADELCGSELVPEVHRRAEPHVKRAIEQLHRVAQLAADPHRAEIDPVPGEKVRTRLPARPAPPVKDPAAPPTWPPAVAEKYAPKAPEPEPAVEKQTAVPAAATDEPSEPETIAHMDQLVRDRFGFYVAPGTRIRHNVLGSGEYVGIGSRGSVYMQTDDGKLVSFPDRYFVRDFRT
ncbi:MAG TPA: hypothetical protein VFS20_30920 [Longimicrobium sp.]|nr:hypothetical protein [Longimicrobium sp.]